MKSTRLILLAGLLGSLFIAVPAFGQGTVFTYQGRLNNGTNLANGSYDLTFALFNVSSGAGQVGGTITNLAVGVTNGLFTVALDFGTNFPGADRWLEVGVRTNGGGAFSTLVPRQMITATPYAITAGKVTGTVAASQLTGTLSAGQLSGVYTNSVTFTNVANQFGGAFTGNGGSLTNLNASQLIFGTVPTAVLFNAWKITGNAGTSPLINFVGTTDNQELELRVFNQRALRLEPNGTSPNVLGGQYNFAPGSVGVAIGGGGNFFEANLAQGNYAVIGGGLNNRAALAATVSGGGSNQALGDFSVIAGGATNVVTNVFAVVSGGGINVAGGPFSVVSGGELNQAIGAFSVVSGGGTNFATELFSTVSGGVSNRAIDVSATVSGGTNNLASGYASVVGGGDNNRAIGFESTASGGFENKSDHTHTTVGGGQRNSATAPGATVGGGIGNVSSGVFATVAGGQNNLASLTGASVGGGFTNRSTQLYSTVGGGELNWARGKDSTVGGGKNNLANSPAATVGGGEDNMATNSHSTIGGGFGNFALATNSTIGGGEGNLASELSATVGGGSMNSATNNFATIGGGSYNLAAGTNATIGGGATNLALYYYATVPGGKEARAEQYGQLAYASGAFTNAGDAQHSLYVVRASTTNSSAFLSLDGDPGETNRLAVGTLRTMTFHILLVARADPLSGTTDSAGYEFTGTVKNDGLSLTFVGPPFSTTFGQEFPGGAGITINMSTLIVSVNSFGYPYPVRWVARVDTSEVAW